MGNSNNVSYFTQCIEKYSFNLYSTFSNSYGVLETRCLFYPYGTFPSEPATFQVVSSHVQPVTAALDIAWLKEGWGQVHQVLFSSDHHWNIWCFRHMKRDDDKLQPSED